MLVHPAPRLLPLDRTRRFRGHVVDDAVDAAYFVDDAGGGAAEHLVRERVVVGGHAVGRGDGAQRADIVVGARVAHHAHGLDRKQHREGLPDLVVEPGFADFVEEDGVGALEYLHALRGHLAGDADRQAGAGERVALDKMLRQAQFATERADLVLEELAQRLDQPEVHPRREAADIMVRLDRDAGAAGGAYRLDDIGVERPLREELDAADLLRLSVKYIDKNRTDCLALGFG